jgi:hypothetical protein
MSIITQEHKDRVGEVTTSTGHITRARCASVDITADESKLDGTVKVSIDSQWIEASDAAELSVYFKRLAKALKKAEARK